MNRQVARILSAAALAMALPLSPVHAQDAPKKEEPAHEKAAEKPQDRQRPPAERKSAPPSLDDLLGLSPDTGEKPPATREKAAEPVDPSRKALDRTLTAKQASEQFAQAVQLMGDTAERLNESRDTGIETQRLQDEIIRKLDMLIQMAEQQQQQQGGGASRASRNPQQQPAQPQQGEAQAGSAGSNHDENAEAPAAEDPSLNPEVAARGAAWGNLPERARDALLQGNADTYSKLYRRWTEEYYRRLAEEGNR